MSLSRLAKNKYLIGILLVLFNLILISAQIPLGSRQTWLEKIIFAIFAPFQRAAVSAYDYAAQGWHNLLSLKDAQKENQELKKQIFFLNQEKELLQEKLRISLGKQDLQNNLKGLEASILPARVIGLDTANYFRSVIIDRGSADGITRNLPVCDYYGHLVGKTTEPISRHEAKVILITSEESGVAVISARDKTPGILTGDGQGKCLIKYVIASSPGGEVGDEILTSGYDQIFPSGLKVGRIISASAEAGLFKKIVVDPYFDFRQIDLVAVLKDSHDFLR
ncbi:MAG TPA: rod shape-determining protein MreC [Candidatus Saccharicenans sp.]|nr:rod shape-determining protein MreC [Candidatus Saccharicenans sp.]HQO75962.1 rod shape-determining protein MreC [Candidatus Saccharicenans sp.]HUM79135.1 rod shape-determining protein MreC [Candidatus Saccharicenans sp.]